MPSDAPAINNNSIVSTSATSNGLPFPPPGSIINFDQPSCGEPPLAIAPLLSAMTLSASGTYLNANEPPSSLNTLPGSFQIEEGYDYDFVDPLDPRFECPICHLCLKDPCQTECGHRFCRLCIQKWISRGQPTCPMDQIVIKRSHIYPDAFAKREVLGLKVKCPHHVHGCQLQLTLRNAEEHKLVCTYTPEACPNFCGTMISLPQLTEHLLTRCQKRLTHCHHCGQAGSHDEMTSASHASGSCASEEIRCDFSAVGCPAVAARKEMTRHAEDKVVDHMLLLCRGLSRLKEEVQVGSTISSAAGRFSNQTIADYQGLVEEVARLQFSIQAQPRVGVDPHRLSPSSNSDVQCGDSAQFPLSLTGAANSSGKGSAFSTLPRSGCGAGLSGGASTSMGPMEIPPASKCDQLDDSQILSTSSSFPELPISTGPVNHSQGDAYSRARWSKFRDDVSGLGERVAGVERTLTHFDKRQKEADLKASEREKEITELQSLRLENSRLKNRLDDMEAKYCNGVLLWKIESFWQLVEEAARGGITARYSPPFYTSPQGYKMCLRINPNGVEGYSGKCVSVFVHMMRGDYDDFLPWPFQGHIYITLLDQSPRLNSAGLNKVPPPRDFPQLLVPTPSVAAYQRPSHLRGLKGFGFKDFIHLDELRNPDAETQGSYVFNDALLVRVDVVDPAPPFGAQVKHIVTTTNISTGHPPSYHLLTGVTQTPQHQNL